MTTINHFSVDIESMSANSNAAIVSIAVVPFTTYSHKKGEINKSQFVRGVDLKSCYEHGLHIDPDTIMWWLKQSDEARKSLSEDIIPLKEMLNHLWGFVHNIYYKDPKSVRWWSHGSSFDMVILENAYKATNIIPPWRYKQFRDTRTIFDLAEIDLDRDYKLSGIHTAVGDSQNQAQAIIDALWKLNPLSEKI